MILDTNAVSDFADADRNLLTRLQQSVGDIHLPVIVLGEYRYGVKSSRLRVARESWLDELESRLLYSRLPQRPVEFMLISVMSFDSPGSRYRRTISGLQLWRGSTDSRF